MKTKRWFLILLVLLFPLGVYAQAAAAPAQGEQPPAAQDQGQGANNATDDGVDQDFSRFDNFPALASQQILEEVSVSQFSDPGFWSGQMSRDYGFLLVRRFVGGPNLTRVQPLASIRSDAINPENERRNDRYTEINGRPIRLENDAETENDRFILGGKVTFARRGLYAFAVNATTPIRIDGLVKEVSFWVAGRGVDHRLELVVKDADGQVVILPAGKLTFNGWNKISVPIPQTVKQFPRTSGVPDGLEIVGFLIQTSLLESYGDFYFYIDDLRAVTDLYAYAGDSEADNPSDSW